MYKIKTVFITTLFILVILELSLRSLGSFAYFLNHDNIEAKFVSNEVRILVIGESTTAPIFSDGVDLAWPSHMRKALQDKFPSHSIEVLNLAIPGTTTAQLVKKFEQIAPVYKPHIVLSMMGVNDHVSMKINKNNEFFKNLKIVKLIEEIERFRRWKKSTDFHSCQIGSQFPLKKSDIDYMIELLKDSDTGVAKFLKHFGGHTKKDNVEIALGFAQVLYQGSFELNSPPNLNPKNFLLLSELAHSMEPNCFFTTQILIYAYISNGMHEACVNHLLKKHDLGIYLNEPLLRNLNECLRENKSEAAEAILNYYGVNNSSRRPIDETLDNYRELAALSESGNYLYYVVPYANTEQILYRNIFSEKRINFINTFFNYITEEKIDLTNFTNSDVEVLENIKEVNSAVKKYGEKEIFKDSFGKKFGHATDLGNKIIGTNVANQLLSSPNFNHLMMNIVGKK